MGFVTSSLKRRWPNGKMPYVIDERYFKKNSYERGEVHTAIKRIKALTNVEMKPRDGESDYVFFTKGKGCSSYVGLQSGKQEIKCDIHPNKFDAGSVVHEIMHALGFFHEQSRPDRNEFVKILFENICEDDEHNFEIRNGFTIGEYEAQSIMHYKKDAFGIGGATTIRALDSGTHPILGGKGKLTDLDIYSINSISPRYSGPRPLSASVQLNSHNLVCHSNVDGSIEMFYIEGYDHSSQRLRHIRQLNPNGSAGWSETRYMLNDGASMFGGDLALSRNRAGCLELFIADGTSIYHMSQRTPGSEDWSSAKKLGGENLDARKIAVGTNKDGRLELAYIEEGTHRLKGMRENPDGNWSSFSDFGDTRAKDLVIGSNKSGRLEIVFTDMNDILCRVSQTNPNKRWANLRAFSDRIKASNLCMSNNKDGRLEVIYTDAVDAQLKHVFQEVADGGWSDAHRLCDDVKATDVTISKNKDGRLEVFYVGKEDGELYHVWQTAPNRGWSNQNPLYSKADIVTSYSNADGRIEIFYQNRFHLFHNWQGVPNAGLKDKKPKPKSLTGATFFALDAPQKSVREEKKSSTSPRAKL